MMRLPFLLAGLLLAATVAAAGGPPAEPSGLAQCRAALDRELVRIERERETVRTLFDADAAAIDAADFTLQKAEQAILAQLAAEQAEAEARYARCRTAAPR